MPQPVRRAPAPVKRRKPVGELAAGHFGAGRLRKLQSGSVDVRFVPARAFAPRETQTRSRSIPTFGIPDVDAAAITFAVLTLRRAQEHSEPGRRFKQASTDLAAR